MCTRIRVWVSVYSRRSAARARSVRTRATPRRCNPDLRSNIVAHKVMWAASLVGNLSGKREHWDLVREISAHIIDVGQAEDGRVLNWAWERGTPYGEAQARADILYLLYTNKFRCTHVEMRCALDARAPAVPPGDRPDGGDRVLVPRGRAPDREGRARRSACLAARSSTTSGGRAPPPAEAESL